MRQQRYKASPFDCPRQLALVFGACQGNSAGNDFAAVGGASAQLFHILVIDVFDLVRAKSAAPPLGKHAFYFCDLSIS